MENPPSRGSLETHRRHLRSKPHSRWWLPQQLGASLAMFAAIRRALVPGQQLGR